MTWKELRHKINLGLVKFKREYGTDPDTLILGKNEFDILKKYCEEDPKNILRKDTDSEFRTDKIWNMEICVDKNSDSSMEMTRKIPDFFSYKEDVFSPYKMKTDIIVPIKFKEVFKSFILKQSDDDIGIQILITHCKDLTFEDFTRFQLHMCGKTKELAIAWSNYLFEIEKILNHGLEKEYLARERLEVLKEI